MVKLKNGRLREKYRQYYDLPGIRSYVQETLENYEDLISLKEFFEDYFEGILEDDMITDTGLLRKFQKIINKHPELYPIAKRNLFDMNGINQGSLLKDPRHIKISSRKLG